MHGESLLDFNVVAVIGSDEIDAYQKENDISTPKILINLLRPLVSSRNLSVVPVLDDSLPIQQG